MRPTSNLIISIGFALAALLPIAAMPAPAYDFDRTQLQSALADLKAWLPGEWNSYPQIWYERNVTLPAEGEHEHWHRSFALIDAPQIGNTVFYGQVNLGGPDGPILARSQVLYKAVIDEGKGVISINGQPVAEPEKFVDLHRRPELWSQVRMPNEAAIHCSFIWHRHGRQLVGVLDAKSPDGRNHGPGTCAYISRNGQEFVADAEWVLSPDELWLYDTNKIGGVQFIGRKDRTHLRLYRAAPYTCVVETPAGKQTLSAHDRGFSAAISGNDDQQLSATLLRAWYPTSSGTLRDELRLTLNAVHEDASETAVDAASDLPRTKNMAVSGSGVQVKCTLD